MDPPGSPTTPTSSPWHPSRHHHDRESRLFFRLALLPRMFPCPRCSPSTPWSIYMAETHALRQGFDPRAWRCGRDTFCPRHTIEFFSTLANSGQPVDPTTPPPPPLAPVYPQANPCPGCFPTSNLALYTAATEALCRHYRFTRSGWRRGPYVFCHACEAQYLHNPAVFRRRHTIGSRTAIVPQNNGNADRPTERQLEGAREDGFERSWVYAKRTATASRL
jgi:hypothetical protein